MAGVPGHASTSTGSRRLPVLMRDLAQGSATLVRQEARLLGLELGSLVTVVARGSVSVAVGAVLLVLGALAMLVGIVFLIGEQWIVGRYWLAALIVAALAGAVAAVAASRGMRLLSPSQLRPSETLETLKETRNG
jgi:drug/metabolite transporter (DMT)-like permease